MTSAGDGLDVRMDRGVSGVRRRYGWVYDFYWHDLQKGFTVWLPLPERIRDWLVDRWMEQK